jgi:hypothetical protein
MKRALIGHVRFDEPMGNVPSGRTANNDIALVIRKMEEAAN